MSLKIITLNFALLFSICAGQGSLQAVQNPHADLGNNHAKSGNYSQALAALNTAIQATPNNARSYKLRGHVYYAMGDYNKALTDLDYVVHLVPNSPNALADRAIVHSVMGNHGLALADIERALGLKPDSTFAESVRKEILERARR
ncbi:MAG TPA: tetratricopeptide repeat protein [Parachlamydiaceae bacterium]|nr:tetratricopeptide repeat protein [Parachlamydiaceae bacterium]